MNANHTPPVPRMLIVILGLLFVLSLGFLNAGNLQPGVTPWMLAANLLLLSVPLGLLYFSIGLFVVAEQQRQSQGQISERLSRILYRTPRIAGVLIVLFVSLFSLDMFGQGGSFWEMLLGFLIHSIPAIVMGVVLAFAWRWEWVGFLAFFGAALFFLIVFFSDPLQALGNFLIFSAPMAAIGLLFWANWKWNKQNRKGAA